MLEETSANELANARKKTILIIDDSREILDLNRLILEMNQFEVLTASTGKEALAHIKIRGSHLSLVLLDLQLAEMTGVDLLATIDADYPGLVDRVPVVFFTAHDSVPLSRARGFIQKRTTVDGFLSQIKAYV